MHTTSEPKPVKCVVWDLDATLWNGVLLEGPVSLRNDTAAVIRGLDARGILQSIASRNYHDQCVAQLDAFGLADFLLCPQISWQPKSVSVSRIAEELNIALNSFAFIDDQPFERAEVQYAHPDVLCINAAQDLIGLLDHPRMTPPYASQERTQRRIMYQQDFHRRAAEESHAGSRKEFLASLDMVLTVTPANADDLVRVEELIERTSQLNSTGYVYSFDELRAFCESPNHSLLVAELRDRFGWYGKIGLALIERCDDAWVLKLLIVSCRVMTRGVGTTLLVEIMRRAKAAGRTLRAEFKPTDRNRIMMVTYRFAGFREAGREGGLTILEHDLKTPPKAPDHVTLRDDMVNC